MKPLHLPFGLSRTALVALLAVYLIWGSTYLAIKLAITFFPPWCLSSLRYLIAGLLMLLMARLQRDAPLTRRQMTLAAASGALLVIANALVGVVEQWIASGTVAVVIGAMPIWIMIIGWAAFAQPRPTVQKIAGALVGLAGIAMIAGGNFTSGSGRAGLGNALLLLSSWSWALGTLIGARAYGLKSACLFSACQMLSGAAATGLASLALEQPWNIPWAAMRLDALLALAYLVVFGSLVAFTAYGWLSRNVQPHIVSTYALVNPVVAVALGWMVFREPLNAHFLAATLLVAVGLGVFLGRPIQLGRREASEG